MFATIINLKNSEEKAKKICSDIAQKDNTFSFEIKNGVLSIFSDDRDKAYKRGILFVKKYLKEYKLGFDVRRI
jgi:hypothetical protein